ncbi:MAG: ABC transporter [unclassified Hahellaceae]|nr:ABC transporter [Hahellaceae bacterium]|tara:strand:- start:22194 stop:22943 length:750 start_codon:yes stop_codon:yes gene_type:complete
MIEFQNLTLGYDRHPVVHHLQAVIPEGAFTALVGPNGAGKSTLLKAVMAQIQPLEGQVIRRGISQQQIAYLPQLAALERGFPICVEHFVSLGLWIQLGATRGRGKSHRQLVKDAIAQVGLSEHLRRPIGELSGGQFQRMLFARLLLQNARLILLDEPFIGVDARTQAELMALLQTLNEANTTIVAVVHDFDLARRHFPSAMLLSRELVAYGETLSVLTMDNLLKAQSNSLAIVPGAPLCAAAARPAYHV